MATIDVQQRQRQQQRQQRQQEQGRQEQEGQRQGQQGQGQQGQGEGQQRWRPAVGRRRYAVLFAAAALAAGLNYLVALGAVALGADARFAPLTAPVFVPLTLLGTAAGYLGWTAVRRRSAAALKLVVPVVLALSMIPDLLLLATKFIPATSGTAVAGLMLMHVVVTAVAVPTYNRIP
ncbi:DUF6069 family protein [Kribbella sp.]|uniref:DUF6069 family protein n=1 Tax=Kribbella sp. TaxID=1871183 RepID=UPI002D3A7342|nr:DUF6069 family protein [Kribbella sp.]HZX07583.1 DUF6069 family protein [Kribbella sp.]